MDLKKDEKKFEEEVQQHDELESPMRMQN